jgi:hypothetical protein
MISNFTINASIFSLAMLLFIYSYLLSAGVCPVAIISGESVGIKL